MLLGLCDSGLVEPGKKLQNAAITAILLAIPSAMTYCLEVGYFCCDSANASSHIKRVRRDFWQYLLV